MWNRNNNNDILDFALVWESLGGPTPESVATAFSIEFAEFNHRLRGAARCCLSRLQQGITSPDVIYGLSAIAALEIRTRAHHRA